jgi:hypothetical protein
MQISLQFTKYFKWLDTERFMKMDDRHIYLSDEEIISVNNMLLFDT